MFGVPDDQGIQELTPPKSEARVNFSNRTAGLKNESHCVSRAIVHGAHDASFNHLRLVRWKLRKLVKAIDIAGALWMNGPGFDAVIRTTEFTQPAVVAGPLFGM
jgi:hypothetical protein